RYDHSIGRDAKFLRVGFERTRNVDRRAWIAGYLNLYGRRFDVWTAAPMATAAYAKVYDEMKDPGAMSVGYFLREQAGKVVVYRNPSALPLAYLRSADGRIMPASLLAFRGSTIFITTDAPFDATLVVTQQLTPGWSVLVDWRGAEPIRDGVFRAVRLARGHHEVTWRYRPLSLVVGSCVTLLALARLLLSLLFVKR